MSKKKKIALATVAGILVLGGVCLLTACGGDGGNTPPRSIIPGPSPAPEDPLQIVDNDNDGTWDDIQTYIIETYPNSAKERAFLTQYAQALQAALVDAGNEDLSMQHFREAIIAADCGEYITGETERPEKMRYALKARFLRVGERAEIYHDVFAVSFGGKMLPDTSINVTADSCMFDLSALPN